MAVQTVFSSNLNPAVENLTTRFTNATGFYILAPLLNAELEIDVFLQVYFPTTLGEQVRNLPLGKIEEQAVLLNITDTQSLVTIPSEYLNTGLEMALLFLASSSTFLQVNVLSPECTLCSLDSKLTTISESLNTLTEDSFTDQLIQQLQDRLLPLIIQGILALLTGGGSVGVLTGAQQFFFLQ